MGEEELDSVLVARVQQGDRHVFDLLVRKYQHKVIGLISRYLNDRSECEDVAQEAFVRAWRAIGSFRGDSQFYTWMYKIAVNTAKNHLVAMGRRPPVEDVIADETVYAAGAERLYDGATPEREMMRQQMEQNVFDTVQALSEELRTAITLREVEGLNYEDIAQAMQCPVGTVRSRIFRAREAIEQNLQPMLTREEEHSP